MTEWLIEHSPISQDADTPFVDYVAEINLINLWRIKFELVLWLFPCLNRQNLTFQYNQDQSILINRQIKLNLNRITN